MTSLVCVAVLVTAVAAIDPGPLPPNFIPFTQKVDLSGTGTIRKLKTGLLRGTYDNPRGSDIPYQLEASNPNFVKGNAGSRQFMAGAKNAAASANIAAQRASIVGFQEGDNPNKWENLRGGAASAGSHRGNGQFSKDGDKTIADWEGNGRGNIRTFIDGHSGKTFDTARAENDRIKAKVDPVTLTRQDGEGTLAFNDVRRNTDKFYLYRFKQNTRSKTVDAMLSKSQGRDRKLSPAEYRALESSAEKWECKGVTTSEGVSECFDQRGVKVGKVISKKDEVKVLNKHGIVVSSGKLTASPRTHVYEVADGKGLVSAKVDGLKYTDCLNEYPGAKKKLRLRKDGLKFKYRGQTIDRQKLEGTFEWPSCFTVEGTFDVDPGVDMSRIALEFDAHVRPIGKLICQDSASCGKGCFYCGYCNSTTKYQILNNGKSNFCTAGAKGGSFKAEMEVCPPKPDKIENCGGFAKDLDYVQNKADGVFEIIAWLQPQGGERLKKFFEEAEFGLLKAINKPKLILEYKTENGLTGWVGPNPTDQELLEWYVWKKRDAKATPIACYRQTVNYKYGGLKVNTNALIDLSTTNHKDFFGKRCAGKERIDRTQYGETKAKAQSQRKTGGGLLGQLGGLIGGRG